MKVLLMDQPVWIWKIGLNDLLETLTMLRDSKHRQTHLLHMFRNHTCDSQSQKHWCFLLVL